MNKFVSTFMAAIGMACYANMPASAQDLAMLGSSGVAPFERAQTKSLKNVLDKLELKYNVHFMYKSKLAKMQLSTVDDGNFTLEEELKNITIPNKLSYKKMGDGFYIVFAKDDEPIIPASKKNDLNSIPSSSLSADVVNASALRTIPVSGVVTDDKGVPLPGVTVLVKGTSNGTSTDVNGAWKLTVPDGNAVLEFSYLGYQKQEVAVNGNTTFNVKLGVDVTSMSEVVVVGYGTQKKVNLTGAISAIDGKEISAKPVGQVSAALQGVAPGVTVTTSSGQPGVDQGTVRIRGVGTTNNTDPLVLVDGVQMSMNDVDANDIQSYSVLKDAAAAAIYGVRAANGVILITTKRGSTGDAKVTYNNYFGWQNPARLAKYVGAQDFMRLVNLTSTNSRGNATYTDAQIAAYDDPNRDRDAYPDNYWLKKILTGSGFQQEHALGVSGGTEKATYHFSANYFDQKGLISNMDFNRITVRLNTDIHVNKKFTLSADISARLNDRNEPQGVAGSAWYQFGQGTVINPLTVDRYSDGVWGIVRGGQNPIRLQKEGGVYNYKSNLFTGNFKGVYDVAKGLKLIGTAAVNYESSYNSIRNRQLNYFTNHLRRDTILPLGLNELTKSAQVYWFRNFQGIADYTKQVGKHSFHVLGGASQLNETTDLLSGYRRDLATGTTQLNGGAADGQTALGYAMVYNLVSFFGRVNYSYDDKYLLEANIRRDGSSRFPTNQKWGTFPSFSLGWRISQESFMQDVKWLDDLKLRGSWGQLGNDRVVVSNDPTSFNYPYQTVYSYGSYPFSGTLNPTAGITIYPNSGLTWETSTMTDIGVDATVFKKLDVTFDYYNRTTKNILMTLPIPPSVGLDPAAMNAAKVQNIGWELGVSYRGSLNNGFKYNVGFNVSDVKNKLLDVRGTDAISQDNNGIYTGLVTGNPINSLYGYKSDGIFQSAEQVANHATQANTTGAGDLIYRDINGDGQITQSLDRRGGDMVYLGNTMPRWTYGVNLGADFKGFDFSAFFQGVGKVDIMTMPIRRAPVSSDGNFREEHLDSWTPTNTGAAFPRLQTTTQNYLASSYWVRSGAYVRLKNVQLGYTLPKAIMSRAGIDRLRVFVSGSNLLTFSSLPNDIDPESPNDSRYYPQVKTFTFGLNVQF